MFLTNEVTNKTMLSRSAFFPGVLKEAIQFFHANILGSTRNQAMVKLRKLFTKVIPKSKSKFKHLDNVPVKSLRQKSHLANFKKALQNAVKRHKKAIGITVVTAASTTAAIAWVNNYITTNSGCFLLNASDDTVCKVQDLSCCQPNPVEGLSFCKNFTIKNSRACDNYVDTTMNDCCLECNCQQQSCLPHQTLECRRPTVGQALSYISENVASTLFDLTSPIWNAIYSWLVWILGGVGILLAIWLVWILFKKFKK